MISTSNFSDDFSSSFILYFLLLFLLADVSPAIVLLLEPGALLGPEITFKPSTGVFLGPRLFIGEDMSFDLNVLIGQEAPFWPRIWII